MKWCASRSNQYQECLVGPACRDGANQCQQYMPEKQGLLEAEFEASKTYWVGLNHRSPHRKDWKYVIWNVKD
jgi:hypothetical protein